MTTTEKMKWHEWFRWPYRILLEVFLLVLTMAFLTFAGPFLELERHEPALEIVVALFLLSLLGLYVDVWRRIP